MVFDLPPLRIGLYFALALFSFILFALCAARIQYTTHLSHNDPLNGGVSFYDPVVVELLFTTLMSMPWSVYIIFVIHKRLEAKYVSKFRDELIVLSILWLFWLVGTGVATSFWGNLSFCSHLNPCRVLTALVAFAWLGWITLSVILTVCVLFSFANKALAEPLHGRWDPRASHFQA